MNFIPALLVLEDGTYYKGWSNSKLSTSIGEVVFNTGMTGYQEIITDPSYCGQIVVFTYPEIGNTGANTQDIESKNISVKGMVARNISQSSYSWRQESSLNSYLEMYGVPSIFGIDTRSLTKHLRKFGSMNGGISNEILEPEHLVKQIQKQPSMKGLNLLEDNTTKISFSWQNNCTNSWNYIQSDYRVSKKFLKVLVLDFGTKFNILRQLAEYGCNVIVLPANVKMETILNYKPDGILLSNGPGDPSAAQEAIVLVNKLIKTNIPIFGICMGHQILSKALSFSTSKLKFGHRGLNHPTGLLQKVEITSQNHGFVVDSNEENKDQQNIQLTHYNLNDKTIAGLAHKQYPLFSVQYHPEASPGPHDSDYLFYYFICLMKQFVSL
uniref:carbamoyl-phosphate synthase arginine-specific small subunit n=1 Tax=Sahlingia subintegra TaxID=468936 RepID=UPI001FCD09A5|nr:carbamoyl-phosphate synthase arginine-specific small subunit [Sahlingia subintegra]UNJ17235.1 carbamoyl-phosphate synthase arginine-specific small subunit [Sahlingia subintegra]